MDSLPACQNGEMEGNGRRIRQRSEQRAIPPPLSHRPGREVEYSVLSYERVWFTRHALERMKQRGVSEQQVFRVLEQPTKKGLRTQVDRERWRRGRVDVVFTRWPDNLCIITVIVVEA